MAEHIFLAFRSNAVAEPRKIDAQRSNARGGQLPRELRPKSGDPIMRTVPCIANNNSSLARMFFWTAQHAEEPLTRAKIQWNFGTAGQTQHGATRLQNVRTWVALYRNGLLDPIRNKREISRFPFTIQNVLKQRRQAV